MIIEDGSGKSFKAKVDENLRLHTQSVTETEAQHAAEVGEAFNINTGTINFTADGTLLYFKNDEDTDFVVESIAVGVGTMTETDPVKITVVRNPTAGDLITDATAVDMKQNRNFGSSIALKTTTCLLYTSPSPRDATLSRMPSSA